MASQCERFNHRNINALLSQLYSTLQLVALDIWT